MLFQNTMYPRKKMKCHLQTENWENNGSKQEQKNSKIAGEQNLSMSEHRKNVTPIEAMECSIWEATRRLKRSQERNPPIKAAIIHRSEMKIKY